ncbi:hypothetical protein HV824_10310 [Myxococcus sp. AM009]|uniref:hypothetical protein n=1 Tax=unclassified Myxococcus TaxID=2648731 RepID=UPI0015953206|nr:MULTISPECIES: hypothetical protein [unclassified Myxococcus]NVI98514.1 hypothetical protein [Myxococcus sp. AM009]NVJ14370.1 hypothetical protein [Myxococcus sp. AM010]
MRGDQWGAMAAVVMALTGCGEDDTYLYDVTLDTETLANVPTECSEYVQPAQGPAVGLEAQQRWTLRKGELDSMFLEVPDIDFQTPNNAYVINGDGAPDVLMGSVGADGGYQFLHIQTRLDEEHELSALGNEHAFRIAIDTKKLEDTIQGTVWVRNEHVERDPVTGSTVASGCASAVRFTGRRARE